MKKSLLLPIESKSSSQTLKKSQRNSHEYSRGHYITNPNNTLLRENPSNFTIDLY